MAGGTFDKNIGKVRPGTYINFESTRQELVTGSERGIVLLPIAKADYGAAKEFITLYNSAPDAAAAKLGYSIYEDDPNGNTLLIREAFKKASTVILYICTENTTAAAGTGGGLSGTAKYKGTRGNDLKFNVISNPVSGFDVEVYLGTNKVETYEKVTAAADLAGSNYIIFEDNGDSGMSAAAGVVLAGGADASACQNADVTAFLDAAENIRWNCMAFPFADSTLQTALKAKIKYMRENIGKGVQAVAPNFAADYEGIINLTNGYRTASATLSALKATAYVAAITAAATNVQSNTYASVDGATEVVELKTHEEAVAAIKAGEAFFSAIENGTVVLEYDINSLVTIVKGKGSTYTKNRVIRVFDTFAEALQLNFPPNKYDNSPDGWDIMEGIGKTILKQFGPTADGGVGAIKNIDYGADFLVDRERSTGDQTYFNVGLEPVDSAEKLYFTIATR